MGILITWKFLFGKRRLSFTKKALNSLWNVAAGHYSDEIQNMADNDKWLSI